MLTLLFALVVSIRDFPDHANRTRKAFVEDDNGLVLYDQSHLFQKDAKALITVPKGEIIDVPTKDQAEYNGIIGYFYDLKPLRFITNAPLGIDIAKNAKSTIGSKFVYGAAGPNTFDRDGIVFYAHLKAGVKIPRVLTSIPSFAYSLNFETVQPGDVFVTHRISSHPPPNHHKKVNITHYHIITDKSNNGFKFIDINYSPQIVVEKSYIWPLHRTLSYNFYRFW